MNSSSRAPSIWMSRKRKKRGREEGVVSEALVTLTPAAV
jgi:hypothetical protein